MSFPVLLFRDTIETEMPNKLFAFAETQIRHKKKKKRKNPGKVDGVQIQCSNSSGAF